MKKRSLENLKRTLSSFGDCSPEVANAYLTEKEELNKLDIKLCVGN